MTPVPPELRDLHRVLDTAPPAEANPIREANALLREVRRLDRQGMAALRRGDRTFALALAAQITGLCDHVDALLRASRDAADASPATEH